jgi:hypothetical protein
MSHVPTGHPKLRGNRLFQCSSTSAWLHRRPRPPFCRVPRPPAARPTPPLPHRLAGAQSNAAYRNSDYLEADFVLPFSPASNSGSGLLDSLVDTPHRELPRRSSPAGPPPPVSRPASRSKSAFPTTLKASAIILAVGGHATIRNPSAANPERRPAGTPCVVYGAFSPALVRDRLGLDAGACTPQAIET